MDAISSFISINQKRKKKLFNLYLFLNVKTNIFYFNNYFCSYFYFVLKKNVRRNMSIIIKSFFQLLISNYYVVIDQTKYRSIIVQTRKLRSTVIKLKIKLLFPLLIKLCYIILSVSRLNENRSMNKKIKKKYQIRVNQSLI